MAGLWTGSPRETKRRCARTDLQIQRHISQQAFQFDEYVWQKSQQWNQHVKSLSRLYTNNEPTKKTSVKVSHSQQSKKNTKINPTKSWVWSHHLKSQYLGLWAEISGDQCGINILAAEPKNLNSISRTHIMEGKNQLLQPVFWPAQRCLCMFMPTPHTLLHTCPLHGPLHAAYTHILYTLIPLPETSNVSAFFCWAISPPHNWTFNSCSSMD